ncbi:MAG: SGNH/GDSL hydrolase family protein [Polyangiaceae bacterium]
MGKRRQSPLFSLLALPLAACTADPSTDGAGGAPSATSSGASTATATTTASSTAGGTGGAGGGPVDPGPTRYPADARHSPMSAEVVARLKAVLAASPNRPDVFAKVGDSITVTPAFLGCLDGSDVDLGAHAALDPSRAFFATTLADAVDSSYDRATQAAVVGWSAGAANKGDPTPIEQEVAAILPGFAVIMFGTNDTYAGGQLTFERNLLADVDALLALGVVPLMSTIPPRGDSAAMNELVPEMNTIIRAIAQYRQVPLMDLHQTLVGLADYGLSGDGVHPATYFSGSYHGCWFNDSGLTEGMNQRNLITLEALDRARRFVVAAEAPEPAPPPLEGSGTHADPLRIDALPFADDRTTMGAESVFDVYGCAPQDESGPEIVYEITLSAETHLRATVYCDDGVDVDLHWLSAPTADACVERDDHTIDLTAGPGTYTLVADSYVSQGVPQSGGYRLTIVALP